MSSPVTNLIKACTVNDKIDLKKLCDTIGVNFKVDKTLNDLCRIGRDKDQKLVIWFQPNVDAKTRFTLVAICIAELILSTDRVNDNGINYDMFALSELNRKKHAPYIMLATRLAIPEHIIEQLIVADEMEFESKKVRDNAEIFDRDAYINNSMFLPDFIKCVVRESTGRLLLDNGIDFTLP